MRGIRASPADTHGLNAGLQYPDVRTSQLKQPTTTTHPRPGRPKITCTSYEVVRNHLPSKLFRPPRRYSLAPPLVPARIPARTPLPRDTSERPGPRHMVLRDPTPGRWALCKVRWCNYSRRGGICLLGGFGGGTGLGTRHDSAPAVRPAGGNEPRWCGGLVVAGRLGGWERRWVEAGGSSSTRSGAVFHLRRLRFPCAQLASTDADLKTQRFDSSAGRELGISSSLR